MASENKDVLRLEGLQGTTGVLVNMRNKMIGFETNGQHRLIHKDNAGNVEYWTPDGETGIDANAISYENAVYPAVADVRAALNAIIAGQTSDSGTLTFIQGLTGTSGTTKKTVNYSYSLVNNVVTMSINSAFNFGDSQNNVKMVGWPIAVWPAYDTYIPIMVRDDDLLVVGTAGAGRLVIPAYAGVTGAETGIVCQILKTDLVSEAPEYSSTWGATGQRGFYRFTAQYPYEAT